MASKKKSDVVESGEVVAVRFRRSFGGYPKAGNEGYLDADLVEKWLAKGHIDLLVADVEVDDADDSEGQSRGDRPVDQEPVFPGAGEVDGDQDS